MTRTFLQQNKPRHLQNHVLPPVQSLPLRSLAGENLRIIWRCIAGTLLFIPFWLAFGFALAFGNAIGTIMSFLSSTKIPQMESADLLSALDALWVALPDVKNPQPIASIVMKLGDDIVMKDFVDILTNRLLNVKNPKGPSPFMYMRFRQRLYTIGSRNIFAFSPRFDIANHIHQIPPDVDDMDAFMTFVSGLQGTPLETDKPLWDMHVRTEFGPDKSGILVFRFHQCITDGQSMIQALCRDILDGGDLIYQQLRPRFGGVTYASRFCQAVFMSGYIFFTDLISGGQPDLNLIKHPEMKLSGKYDVFWSEPVNFSVIQRLKSITRCHFNDLFFTALAATMRTYCKMHGISTPADMTACFPIDLRSAKAEGLNDMYLGNRFVMEKIHLPVGQEAGLPMLWRVRDQTYQIRRSYRHVATDFLVKILGKAFSQKLMHSIWNRHFSGCTLLVNSLAGPEGILTVSKFTLEEMRMWIPPPHEMGVPLAINVISNLDQVQLVVVADTGVIQDAYWIAMDFPHEVMALGNLLKTRRVPESGGSKNAEAMSDEDAEQAVTQSLGVLKERLIKIQMKVRKMRKNRDDIGKIPALWKTFGLDLPAEGESSSSSSSSGSESDSESESGETSSDTASGDASSASGEESGKSKSEGETEKSSAEESANSASASKTNSIKVEAKKKPKPDKKEPKPANGPPVPLAKDEVTKASGGERRLSGAQATGARLMERRMSTKPTIFSAPRSRSALDSKDQSETDFDALAQRNPQSRPGQVPRRRSSQAGRTIPSTVPAVNRMTKHR